VVEEAFELVVKVKVIYVVVQLVSVHYQLLQLVSDKIGRQPVLEMEVDPLVLHVMDETFELVVKVIYTVAEQVAVRTGSIRHPFLQQLNETFQLQQQMKN